MAEVRIADVIVPEVFNDYVTQNTAEKSAVIQSGLVSMDADLSNKLAGGGLTFNMPAWGDLANTDGSVSSDDPTDLLTLQKIGTYSEIAGRMTLNEGWSAMTFASELAGSDAMNRIGDRVAAYWARKWNRFTINTILGVMGENQATNGGDMFYDAGAAAMSGQTVLNAQQLLGDNADKLSIMVVHSKVHNTMQKQGLLTNAFTREDDISANMIQLYMGKYRVVVDDSMPNGNAQTAANPGGGASVNGVALTANQFVSVISAPGTIAMGETAHKFPVDVDDVPRAGGGSGEEQLIHRKIFSFHPRGHQISYAGIAGQTPTVAELALAARWTRVYPEQKQMGMIAVQTTEA